MEKRTNNIQIKWLVVLTFILMIVMNVLANTLPINGINTGDVSDSYPNLFAPTALTFSIWGLIYLLLAAHTLYHIGLFRTDSPPEKIMLLEKTGLIFSFSSFANAVWILSWHYLQMPLSMVLMLVILISLIWIGRMIGKEQLTTREKFFIKLPFSIYFGWITVATIANATTLLVSWNWNGFGIAEPVWTILIVSVGLLIGLTTMVLNIDIAYGCVLIWAYIGILIKHTSADGFAGQYQAVIVTVIICLILLVVGLLYILFKRKNATI
ncbi:MAG: tryptophan-rich sensory protein [Actinobacteria bacterium]|nr:tryptophan-rich sensory protein [Actinomycetota bacterium]